MIEVFAPAKVNLTLHITGQREDGYHLLDSLVVFADVGDVVRAETSEVLSLTVDGPEAADVPVTDDNSLLQAARLFAPTQGAAFHLTKNLPVASGIGGGSTDAAAAIRALRQIAGDTSVLTEADTARAATLGADVPVCLHTRTTRMRGIGEDLSFTDALPALPAVLVNPRVQVATPKVFGEISQKNNPAMPAIPSHFDNVADVAMWLADRRNDMQDAAVALAPEIALVLAKLTETTSCLLSRMSGSGATCFGLYPDAHSAVDAAQTLARTHPDWWVVACTLGDPKTS